MGFDEEGTLTALKQCRKELVDPKIAEHRGRIVKTTGDGVLVEFASAVDAVRCAIEIQLAMTERSAKIPEDRRIEFRIGINVGDIIIDEGDIYGDGVNIASRVETLASPGAICISDSVYQQIKGKLAIDVIDMGEQDLKNIAQPVRVFGVRNEIASASPALALPIERSVAQLVKSPWFISIVAGVIVALGVAVAGIFFGPQVNTAIPTIGGNRPPAPKTKIEIRANFFQDPGI
jgi:adenylate cyclase